jgi:hypothetical protein
MKHAKAVKRPGTSECALEPDRIDHAIFPPQLKERPFSVCGVLMLSPSTRYPEPEPEFNLPLSDLFLRERRGIGSAALQVSNALIA